MEKDDLQLFEAGESTALVCIDHEQYQKMVVPQLTDLKYKSTWAFTKKMCCSSCALILMTSLSFYEKLQGSALATNPILQKLVCESAAQRREQFVVLLSHLFPTNDSMAAFVHSVDRIVNIADLPNFKQFSAEG